MLHGLVSRHHCPTMAAPDPSGCASIFRCRWISWSGEAPAVHLLGLKLWERCGDHGIQPAGVAADDCRYFGLNLGCGWLWLTIAPISVRGCSFRSGLWIPPWGPPDHRACDFPRQKKATLPNSNQYGLFMFVRVCHEVPLLMNDCDS